jgi:hypothetical protein
MISKSFFGTIVPCAAPPAGGIVGKGGKREFNDKTTEVRTGVTVTKDGKVVESDAISIAVKCTKNPHVIQFIHREIIGADGKRKSYSITTSTGSHEVTTTDPDQPAWLTDASQKTSPFYDDGGLHSSDASGLTIYDEPALIFVPDTPTPSGPSAPIVLKPGEMSKATFKAYTLCDGKVVKEVTWVRSVRAPKDPSSTPKPAYDKPTVEDSKELPPWAKEQLKKDGHYDPTDPASVQERAKKIEALKRLLNPR